jgi:multisubunit Na+/H+ antiporter MnhE subunit
VIGFLAPNIDWRAHLGGLVTGALVAAIMVLPKRRHRLMLQTTGLITVAVLLLLVAAWRTNAIVTEYGPFIMID